MEKITGIDVLNYVTMSWQLRRFITWLGKKCADIRTPWIKNKQIALFNHLFPINWQEAEFESVNDYPHFNAFFTRRLKLSARPIDRNPYTLICPVDGVASAFGNIQKDQLFQAKGFYYGLSELVGDPQVAQRFHDGHFATFYLAPQNYHRVHAPFAGRLAQMRYIPGRLFSVTAATTQKTPQLFTRNERLVTLFETAQGPMVVIFVGAGLVGSIVTPWAGAVCPPHGRAMQAWRYLTDINHAISFDRGEEIGHFALGSTVIVLLPAKSISWDKQLSTNHPVKMGTAMAQWDNVVAQYAQF